MDLTAPFKTEVLRPVTTLKLQINVPSYASTSFQSRRVHLATTPLMTKGSP